MGCKKFLTESGNIVSVLCQQFICRFSKKYHKIEASFLLLGYGTMLLSTEAPSSPSAYWAMTRSRVPTQWHVKVFWCPGPVTTMAAPNTNCTILKVTIIY